MEHRYLGASGLLVSELCLGSMTFGGEADEAVSRQLLDRYVDAGGNFVDTADVYGDGASEEIIGRWLAGRVRDDLVIATKFFWPTGGGPNDHGAGRKHIISAVHASLRRLGTDHIDLYQVHAFDESTPLDETLSTLDGLVRAGTVRHLGVSNYAGWQLQKSVDLSRRHGWEPFACLQPLYNLLDREAEWDLLPVCRGEGLGVIPWSPLRGGWLSGKYHRGLNAPPADTRVTIADQKGWSESWSRYGNERTWGIVDELQAVAKDTGKTVAQVALRWVLQRPGVTSPIIGARSMTQLEDNLGSTGWSLSDELMTRLTTVSE
jgi:aryl-alcohol dehydrogenase-like predicted oxidoreductase